MIRAVIFDFDGVILESADLKTEAFRKLFEKEHPREVEAIVAHHKENMGISRFVKFRHVYREILKKPLSNAEEKRLGDLFSELVRDEIRKSPLVAGASAFLSRHARSLPLFVASGTPQMELLEICREKGVFETFREIHGSPKEKVGIIRDIQSRHGFSPKEILFVGDAPSDLSAARVCSVWFVGRIHGDHLRPGDCDHAIKDLTELGTIIERINQKKGGDHT